MSVRSQTYLWEDKNTEKQDGKSRKSTVLCKTSYISVHLTAMRKTKRIIIRKKQFKVQLRLYQMLTIETTSLSYCWCHRENIQSTECCAYIILETMVCLPPTKNTKMN